jgi:hypothetical protein
VLEFQLAADILTTAVVPTWSDLGKLAVTAVIRTGLNYFLGREIKEETAERAKEEARVTERAEGANDARRPFRHPSDGGESPAEQGGGRDQ